MPYVDYSIHFENYTSTISEPERRQIAKFIATFLQHGLGDFNNYVGKIKPSWKTNDDAIIQYAYSNNLWHAHIGYPQYNQLHGKYKTSDYFVHFIWDRYNNINLIKLVDYTPHLILGKFPMPQSYKLI